ncbi:putative threonine efflux protein [Xenococcus sp. PCC 7305]|uniref:LysE family translocator n=1 Tax=Xenococcus sp. PCC 7305 TaxID=102125 RepID=UPI0002AC8B29|nr:LysE family translocator [Xenococcus sp. PCC 7305]ELS02908.1 putative threonine efflux protein [Xenococcus sp. PCC 7305]
MTWSSIFALFGTMFVLAMIPGPSVFAVVARSISSGFTHGLITVAGIVVGDFIFIILAIYGLSAIAETLGSLFMIVKYLGAAYLIWLGIQLWRSRNVSLSGNQRSHLLEGQEIKELSWLSNFMTGLLITLADHKAIFFYMSFFPAFLDLSQVSVFEVGIIMVVAAIAVGGSKLVYAYLANRARFIFESSRAKRRLNMTAGALMIATGFFLAVKT